MDALFPDISRMSNGFKKHKSAPPQPNHGEPGAPNSPLMNCTRTMMPRSV